VSAPEDALARARAEAERLRAEGVYDAGAGERAPAPAVTAAQLIEWAVIEPALSEVRSTRAYGAPITTFKRGLVRLLAQYNRQLAAQQTRFNLNLLARVQQLEERIGALEDERREP
jgi:hypothetical protein